MRKKNLKVPSSFSSFSSMWNLNSIIFPPFSFLGNWHLPLSTFSNFEDKWLRLHSHLIFLHMSGWISFFFKKKKSNISSNVSKGYQNHSSSLHIVQPDRLRKVFVWIQTPQVLDSYTILRRVFLDRHPPILDLDTLVPCYFVRARTSAEFLHRARSPHDLFTSRRTVFSSTSRLSQPLFVGLISVFGPIL